MKLNSGKSGPWLSAKNNPECEGQIITFKDEANGEKALSTRMMTVRQ